MICVLCSSQDIKKEFKKSGKDYFRCSNCGFIFIHPHPSPEDLKEVYGKEYFHHWGEEEVRRVKFTTFRRWLARIESYQSPGKLLDLGCAMGFFLETARARGWDVYGIEMSEYSARIAAKTLGDRVQVGALRRIDFESGIFDCVTLFDLIEHIGSPVDLLKEVSRVLKPGGLAVLSSVNTQSFSAGVLRSRWPHYHSEHLSYFNPEVMKLALEKAGLQVLAVGKAEKYLSLAYIYFAFQAHPVFPFRVLSRFLYSVLPRRLSGRPFPADSGEMFVLARKEGGV